MKLQENVIWRLITLICPQVFEYSTIYTVLTTILRCIDPRSKENQINFLMTAHLEQCVRGVLLEEGAGCPLPPGSGCSHLRLHLGQWIEPDRDGATPGQQALQLLQVSIAAATLCEVHSQKQEG